MIRRPRFDWVVVVTAILFASGCGGGCGGCGMEPIPGGFPAAERNPNAAQARVTQSGLAKVAADPAGLLGGLAGGMNGVLQFNVPASCGGSTPVCCPGGNPVSPCGPIDIDLNAMPGDLPRLELRPSQGNSRLDVTVRARIKTGMDIPVTVPIAGDCGIKIDTAGGSPDDIQIDAPISFVQDATAGTTRVVVGTVTLSNLSDDDVDLTGGFGCDFANLGLSFFIDTLADQLTGAVQSAIQDQVCKACPSGDVAECGTFATACTDEVCMQGTECMQELGISGRARGTNVFASLSPGTTGALDLYEVAGGYATSNSNGLALGLLGGMLPGGAPRDRCGPAVATPPVMPAITPSPFFQGNTRPDTGAAFDIGFGLHASQLEQLAYAAYDGGLLCLTITGNTIAQLSTDTLSLISRSLGNLNEGNAPMAVGLRPQSPPVIVLGKNTFMDDGMGNMTLVDPLLDISFTAMEVDFFAAVDDQYIRVFTVVADVHLPVGLQVTGMGEIQPVIGAVENAFTNISVKNSEAVTETPERLAELFPSILNLVLPQLSGGLSPISLPSLGGLNMAVTDITGIPQNSGGADVTYLAIFANLVPATMARPVDTRVSLGDIYQPDPSVFADPLKWRGVRQPAVTLVMGDGEGLEWSWRINGGAWSAWSASATQTITSNMFWLAGTHKVEVRAREIGRPETIDRTPAALDVALGNGAAVQRAPVRPFHGQPGQTGCECQSAGAGTASPFALVLLMIVLPMRRARRRIASLLRGARRAVRRPGAVAWLAAIAMLPGCSCGSNPCGDAECLPGEIAHGGLGRWTSIAGDDTRVMVATYDQGFGDVVAVDVTDPASRIVVAVDGIPEDVTPTYDPGSYRGGVEDPGPNVGAWTSIAMADGHAMIAYQDRDAGALKLALETKPGSWRHHIVDPGDGIEVGRYASLVVDGQGRPAIAYIALGIDNGMGQRMTELRIARANRPEPDTGDWTTVAVASAAGTCGGLCAAGEACVAGDAGESCAAVTSDCTAMCASDEACVAGSCTAAIGEPAVADIGTGTGLFVSLLVLPDGRLAAVYYDRSVRALMLAVESAVDSNTFAETALDSPMIGDRGAWASAVVDGAGTIHIAYQDAIGDQLVYTTWNGTPGTPEIVDDGQRMGERTHPVGAAAAIYLVNGTPTIAYQDGLTADVYLASQGAPWTITPFAVGPLLDGFSIAATTAHGGAPYLAWDQLDPALTPPNGLAVQTP